jgi:hypothetical protein
MNYKKQFQKLVDDNKVYMMDIEYCDAFLATELIVKDDGKFFAYSDKKIDENCELEFSMDDHVLFKMEPYDIIRGIQINNLKYMRSFKELPKNLKWVDTLMDDLMSSSFSREDGFNVHYIFGYKDGIILVNRS